MPDYYIGLMSGTSLDGIDAALVAFDNDNISLSSFVCIPFDAEIKHRIHAISQASARVCLKDYGALDTELGFVFADAVKHLLVKTQIPASQILAIGSHGQTVYHAPDLPLPFSLQIGDPNIIAERTGITTIADFRRRDIAVGGQGAPLVPAFHNAVFSHLSEYRVVVNIGGIANITVLPPVGDPAKILGFDTGPGNTLMDLWIKIHHGLDYDENGHWAESGQVCPALLAQLADDRYFHTAPPKSTGKEYFSLDWLLANLNGQDYKIEDVQATLCALTALSVGNAIKQYAPKTQRVLVCGGGAHNRYLLSLLAQCLACPVCSTGDFGLHPDQVEAVAFAWLAKQTIEGKPGNLIDATGASKPVVLGGIYRSV